MTAAILGLDIGGANLKAAHSSGRAWSRPFALWKRPHDLSAELRRLVVELPPFDRVAATMTGELCDCFPTSRAGVLHILDALATALPQMPIHIWRTDGRFVALDVARNDPRPCAAANWLALATFAGRFAPAGPALVVDIGSTTTDLVPLLDGLPVPAARTDPERLKAGELVYTGVRRTPACRFARRWRGGRVFRHHAGHLSIAGTHCRGLRRYRHGRRPPGDRAGAHSRLARMLCGDAETITHNATLALAKRLALVQRQTIDRAARQFTFHSLVLSGVGEFLARDVFADFTGPVVSLAEKLGPERSAAACAMAVAELLQAT